MKKKKEIDVIAGNRCCPLGSLTLLSRKIGKIFRCHMMKLNVTNSQVGIFMILFHKREVVQNKLSLMLDLDKSTISRDLVRMVDRGYLFKANGKRSPIIGLTQKGEKLANEIYQEWEKGYAESVKILGEDGFAALRLLEKKLLEDESAIVYTTLNKTK
ncbi:MAG: DNA-binding MarR family transcriptional regulator [Glaciecola sp.]